jgi:hypothetical protein
MSSAFLPSAVHAHEIKAGLLVIVHPTVDEAENGQALARGSTEIRNKGKIADELLSRQSLLMKQQLRR